MKIRIMKTKKRKEMEQSIGMFSEDERQVAQILVDDLPHVILHLKAALLPLPFTWGCKRMRSAVQVTPATTQCAAPPLHHGGAVVAPPFKAPNPATPLSLSPTESDDKTKKPLRLKASLKRKREYYLKIIGDLTKHKASLHQEIDNVKRYSDQLRAFNLKLKERKQELNNSPNKSESKNPSLVNASVNSSNSMAENQGQQLKLQVSNTSHCVPLMMLNHTSGPSQICNNEGIAQFQYGSGHHTTTSLPLHSSYCSALGMVNTSNTSPLGILDLNVRESTQVEPCQPLDVTAVNKDLNKAMAAQARQRRIQINRLKNFSGNCKTRY